MLVKIGVLPAEETNLFEFGTFDCETVAAGEDQKISEKTTVHGYHSIISIAITTTWDKKSYFFLRDDMTRGSAKKLISQFLFKIKDLAGHFDSILPKTAIDYHEKIKDDLKSVSLCYFFFHF